MATINSVGVGLKGTTGTGTFVGSTSPTITTPRIATINGASAAICNFSQATSAVNSVTIGSSATGSPPRIFTTGADTDIDLLLGASGIGGFRFATQKTSQQIGIYDSVTATFSGLLTFPNIGSAYEIIFQTLGGTVCIDQSSSGSITTQPPASSTGSLALDTAYFNSAGYDVQLTVYVSVTAATADDILLGVGSTATPTQSTIVSSLTTVTEMIIPVSIYLPSQYYALLSVGAGITATISGQIAMPI